MTPKQAIFVAEYLIDGNAARAARMAGYEESSARVTGARLLTNANIAAAIAHGQARAAEKCEVRAERTLRKLAEIAYGDVAELLDEDGSVLPVPRMKEGARTLIAGLDIEVTDGPGRVRTVAQKVKIADRIRALELLGKYQKLFGDGAFGATVETPGGLPADSTIKIVLVRPE